MESLIRFISIYNGIIFTLHTKYYAIIYGYKPNKFREWLSAAVNTACTRALYGDHYGRYEYSVVEKMERFHEAVEFSNTIELKGNGSVICVPSVNIVNKNLTNIGLGDNFVGGFFTKILDISE